jgi:type II secretory pathway pseudopilin PulG
MFTKTKNPDHRRARRARTLSEGSFTLIETVIALSLVAFLIVEVAAVQGNSIVFSDYQRNVTQATYLAQRVMSQVEYFWRTKPFPELETNVTDGKFDDGPCVLYGAGGTCDEAYQYTLGIKEWKFPFLQLLQSTMGGGGGGEGEGDDGAEKKPEAGGMGQMLETVMSQVFGKEPIFMTAHVEVSWAEGAARNSTGLTLLLTNQAKLDEAIVQLKPVWDRLTKPPTAKKDDKKTPTPPGGPAGAGGQPSPIQPPGGGSNPPTGEGV